jgi:hypothetical protein
VIEKPHVGMLVRCADANGRSSVGVITDAGRDMPRFAGLLGYVSFMGGVPIGKAVFYEPSEQEAAAVREQYETWKKEVKS